MRLGISYIGLFFVSFALAQSGPPKGPTAKDVECRAGLPANCKEGKTTFTFEPDTLEMNLRNYSFMGNYHGNPGFWGSATWAANFTNWPSNYRFALTDLSYYGLFNSSDGIQLYRLRTEAVLDSDVPTDGLNTTSTLFDIVSKVAVGGNGTFEDYFKVNAENSGLVWSPCFDSSINAAITVTVDADVRDKGIGPWIWGGFRKGLTLTWGVAWEEC
ncbi:uncharacterized protein F4822DRAFT_228374 [Hypoxylon trugodes]|uniref:uncharacterized protein n=1 Tax=Hypoxylon trugodes TaxID=326681 RepID=UPI00218E5DB4|nr:uncharacterized protein F4822DRAFT_228374 [Hypoxylon trugodes]KAI1390190.1 hypothetical protein F4822DRAFT_228374 [Hypoxylon trugodes]